MWFTERRGEEESIHPLRPLLTLLHTNWKARYLVNSPDIVKKQNLWFCHILCSNRAFKLVLQKELLTTPCVAFFDCDFGYPPTFGSSLTNFPCQRKRGENGGKRISPLSSTDQSLGFPKWRIAPDAREREREHKGTLKEKRQKKTSRKII